ncbi:Hypothetical predicted protein [Olea europaea subsp. europaea]|uniref:Uncharacterized protein n=1 Tax=Olea europaea subsp. europaea TaxID=158383 RepID=A0A8S0VBW6_OLEEU|nr:Hypothetical predicted protein [Olea europaea subsp. europaea]
MNTKGPVKLIVHNVGKDQKVLDAKSFASTYSVLILQQHVGMDVQGDAPGEPANSPHQQHNHFELSKMIRKDHQKLGRLPKARPAMVKYTGR